MARFISPQEALEAYFRGLADAASVAEFLAGKESLPAQPQPVIPPVPAGWVPLAQARPEEYQRQINRLAEQLANDLALAMEQAASALDPAAEQARLEQQIKQLYERKFQQLAATQVWTGPEQHPSAKTRFPSRLQNQMIGPARRDLAGRTKITYLANPIIQSRREAYRRLQQVARQRAFNHVEIGLAVQQAISQARQQILNERQLVIQRATAMATDEETRRVLIRTAHAQTDTLLAALGSQAIYNQIIALVPSRIPGKNPERSLYMAARQAVQTVLLRDQVLNRLAGGHLRRIRPASQLPVVPMPSWEPETLVKLRKEWERRHHEQRVWTVRDRPEPPVTIPVPAWVDQKRVSLPPVLKPAAEHVQALRAIAGDSRYDPSVRTQAAINARELERSLAQVSRRQAISYRPVPQGFHPQETVAGLMLRVEREERLLRDAELLQRGKSIWEVMSQSHLDAVRQASQRLALIPGAAGWQGDVPKEEEIEAAQGTLKRTLAQERRRAMDLAYEIMSRRLRIQATLKTPVTVERRQVTAGRFFGRPQSVHPGSQADYTRQQYDVYRDQIARLVLDDKSFAGLDATLADVKTILWYMQAMRGFARPAEAVDIKGGGGIRRPTEDIAIARSTLYGRAHALQEAAAEVRARILEEMNPAARTGALLEEVVASMPFQQRFRQELQRHLQASRIAGVQVDPVTLAVSRRVGNTVSVLVRGDQDISRQEYPGEVQRALLPAPEELEQGQHETGEDLYDNELSAITTRPSGVTTPGTRHESEYDPKYNWTARQIFFRQRLLSRRKEAITKVSERVSHWEILDASHQQQLYYQIVGMWTQPYLGDTAWESFGFPHRPLATTSAYTLPGGRRDERIYYSRGIPRISLVQARRLYERHLKVAESDPELMAVLQGIESVEQYRDMLVNYLRKSQRDPSTGHVMLGSDDIADIERMQKQEMGRLTGGQYVGGTEDIFQAFKLYGNAVTREKYRTVSPTSPIQYGSVPVTPYGAWQRMRSNLLNVADELVMSVMAPGERVGQMERPFNLVAMALAPYSPRIAQTVLVSNALAQIASAGLIPPSATRTSASTVIPSITAGVVRLEFDPGDDLFVSPGEGFHVFNPHVPRVTEQDLLTELRRRIGSDPGAYISDPGKAYKRRMKTLADVTGISGKLTPQAIIASIFDQELTEIAAALAPGKQKEWDDLIREMSTFLASAMHLGVDDLGDPGRYFTPIGEQVVGEALWPGDTTPQDRIFMLRQNILADLFYQDYDAAKDWPGDYASLITRIRNRLRLGSSKSIDDVYNERFRIRRLIEPALFLERRFNEIMGGLERSFPLVSERDIAPGTDPQAREHAILMTLALGREQRAELSGGRDLAREAPVMTQYLTGRSLRPKEAAIARLKTRGPPDFLEADVARLELAAVLNAVFEAIAQASNVYQIYQESDARQEKLGTGTLAEFTIGYDQWVKLNFERQQKGQPLIPFASWMITGIPGDGSRRGIGLAGLETIEDWQRFEDWAQKAIKAYRESPWQVEFPIDLLRDAVEIFRWDVTGQAFASKDAPGEHIVIDPRHEDAPSNILDRLERSSDMGIVSLDIRPTRYGKYRSSHVEGALRYTYQQLERIAETFLRWKPGSVLADVWTHPAIRSRFEIDNTLYQAVLRDLDQRPFLSFRARMQRIKDNFRASAEQSTGEALPRQGARSDPTSEVIDAQRAGARSWSSEPIFFNSQTEEWRWLSNLATTPFRLKTSAGEFEFQALEGAYQVAKHRQLTPELVAKFAKMSGPEAWQAGKALPAEAIRPDWETFRVTLMERLLRSKFADPELQARLLATGDRPLIHEAPWDPFWGTGRDKQGENRLGKLLERLRAELRQAKPRQYRRGTGYHPGGPAIIGEAGPEIVTDPKGNITLVRRQALIPDLPAGTKVFSAGELRSIAHGQGSPAVTTGQMSSGLAVTTRRNAFRVLQAMGLPFVRVVTRDTSADRESFGSYLSAQDIFNPYGEIALYPENILRQKFHATERDLWENQDLQRDFFSDIRSITAHEGYHALRELDAVQPEEERLLVDLLHQYVPQVAQKVTGVYNAFYDASGLQDTGQRAYYLNQEYGAHMAEIYWQMVHEMGYQPVDRLPGIALLEDIFSGRQAQKIRPPARGYALAAGGLVDLPPIRPWTELRGQEREALAFIQDGPFWTKEKSFWERSRYLGSLLSRYQDIADLSLTRGAIEAIKHAGGPDNFTKNPNATFADARKSLGEKAYQRAMVLVAGAFLNRWHGTTRNPSTIERHVLVADMFDEDGPFQIDPDLWSEAGARLAFAPSYHLIEKFLMEQTYAWTQEELAKAGLKELYLARGMAAKDLRGWYHDEPRAIGAGPSNILASFSPDFTMVGNFSGLEGQAWTSADQYLNERVRITGIIPAERIFSTGRTGFGAFHESEFVVIGGHPDDQYLIRNVDDLSKIHKQLNARRLETHRLGTVPHFQFSSHHDMADIKGYRYAIVGRDLRYLETIARKRFPLRYARELDREIVYRYGRVRESDRLPRDATVQQAREFIRKYDKYIREAPRSAEVVLGHIKDLPFGRLEHGETLVQMRARAQDYLYKGEWRSLHEHGKALAGGGLSFPPEHPEVRSETDKMLAALMEAIRIEPLFAPAPNKAPALSQPVPYPGLSPEQSRIFTLPKRPEIARFISGAPGAGKTYTEAQYIYRQLRSGRAPEGLPIWTSFTTTAVHVAQKALQKLGMSKEEIGRYKKAGGITTISSLGMRIAQMLGPERVFDVQGVPRGAAVEYEMATDAEEMAMMRQVIYDLVNDPVTPDVYRQRLLDLVPLRADDQGNLQPRPGKGEENRPRISIDLELRSPGHEGERMLREKMRTLAETGLFRQDLLNFFGPLGQQIYGSAGPEAAEFAGNPDYYLAAMILERMEQRFRYATKRQSPFISPSGQQFQSETYVRKFLPWEQFVRPLHYLWANPQERHRLGDLTYREYVITEAQDFNLAQHLLLRELTGGDQSYHIFSGDPLQDIFWWRGGTNLWITTGIQAAEQSGTFMHLGTTERFTAEQAEFLNQIYKTFFFQEERTGREVPLLQVPGVKPSAQAQHRHGPPVPIRFPVEKGMRLQEWQRDVTAALAAHLLGKQDSLKAILPGERIQLVERLFDSYNIPAGIAHPGNIIIPVRANIDTAEIALRLQEMGIPVLPRFAETSVKEWAEFVNLASDFGIDIDNIDRYLASDFDMLPEQEQKMLLAFTDAVRGPYTAFHSGPYADAAGEFGPGAERILKDLREAVNYLALHSEGIAAAKAMGENALALVGTVYALKGEGRDIAIAPGMTERSWPLETAESPERARKIFADLHTIMTRGAQTIMLAPDFPMSLDPESQPSAFFRAAERFLYQGQTGRFRVARGSGGGKSAPSARAIMPSIPSPGKRRPNHPDQQIEDPLRGSVVGIFGKTFAQGSLDLAHDVAPGERAIIGEAGPEILVKVNQGRFYEVDRPAEITVEPGDMVIPKAKLVANSEMIRQQIRAKAGKPVTEHAGLARLVQAMYGPAAAGGLLSRLGLRQRQASPPRFPVGVQLGWRPYSEIGSFVTGDPAKGYQLDLSRAILAELGTQAKAEELASLLESTGLYVERFERPGQGRGQARYGLRALGASAEHMAAGVAMARLWELHNDPATGRVNREYLKRQLSPEFLQGMGLDLAQVKELAAMGKASGTETRLRAYDQGKGAIDITKPAAEFVKALTELNKIIGGNVKKNFHDLATHLQRFNQAISEGWYQPGSGRIFAGRREESTGSPIKAPQEVFSKIFGRRFEPVPPQIDSEGNVTGIFDPATATYQPVQAAGRYRDRTGTVYFPGGAGSGTAVPVGGSSGGGMWDRNRGHPVTNWMGRNLADLWILQTIGYTVGETYQYSRQAIDVAASTRQARNVAMNAAGILPAAGVPGGDQQYKLFGGIMNRIYNVDDWARRGVTREQYYQNLGVALMAGGDVIAPQTREAAAAGDKQAQQEIQSLLKKIGDAATTIAKAAEESGASPEQAIRMAYQAAMTTGVSRQDLTPEYVGAQFGLMYESALRSPLGLGDFMEGHQYIAPLVTGKMNRPEVDERGAVYGISKQQVMTGTGWQVTDDQFSGLVSSAILNRLFEITSSTGIPTSTAGRALRSITQMQYDPNARQSMFMGEMARVVAPVFTEGSPIPAWQVTRQAPYAMDRQRGEVLRTGAGTRSTDPQLFQQVMQLVQMPYQEKLAESQYRQTKLELDSLNLTSRGVSITTESGTVQLSSGGQTRIQLQSQQIQLEMQAAQRALPLQMQQTAAQIGLARGELAVQERRLAFEQSIQPLRREQFDLSQAIEQRDLARSQRAIAAQRAYETALYGPPGVDRSYQNYLAAQRGFMVAGQGAQTANLATSADAVVNAVGLQAAQTYAAIQHQRSMLIYGQSSLSAGAAFEEQMRYLKAQERFAERGFEAEDTYRTETRAIQDEQLADRTALLAKTQELERALFDERERQLNEEVRLFDLRKTATEANIQLMQLELELMPQRHAIQQQLLDIELQQLDIEDKLNEERKTQLETEIAQMEELIPLQKEFNDAVKAYLAGLGPFGGRGDMEGVNPATGIMDNLQFLLSALAYREGDTKEDMQRRVIQAVGGDATAAQAYQAIIDEIMRNKNIVMTKEGQIQINDAQIIEAIKEASRGSYTKTQERTAADDTGSMGPEYRVREQEQMVQSGEDTAKARKLHDPFERIRRETQGGASTIFGGLGGLLDMSSNLLMIWSLLRMAEGGRGGGAPGRGPLGMPWPSGGFLPVLGRAGLGAAGGWVAGEAIDEDLGTEGGIIGGIAGVAAPKIWRGARWLAGKRGGKLAIASGLALGGYWLYNKLFGEDEGSAAELPQTPWDALGISQEEWAHMSPEKQELMMSQVFIPGLNAGPSQPAQGGGGWKQGVRDIARTAFPLFFPGMGYLIMGRNSLPGFLPPGYPPYPMGPAPDGYPVYPMGPMPVDPFGGMGPVGGMGPLPGFGTIARGGRLLARGAKFLAGKGALRGGAIGLGLGIGGWALDKGFEHLGIDTGGAFGTVGKYAGIGAALGTVIPGVGTAIGAGVGAAVGAGVWALQNPEKVKKAAEEVWDVTVKGYNLAKDAIEGGKELVINAAHGAVEKFNDVKGWFGDRIDDGRDLIDGAAQAAVDKYNDIKGWFGDRIDDGRDLVSGVAQATVDKFNDIKGWFGDRIDSGRDFVSGAAQAAIDKYHDITGWFGDHIDSGVDAVTGAAQGAIDKFNDMKGWFGDHIDSGTETVIGAAAAILGKAGEVKDWFVNKIQEGYEGVIGAAGDILNKIGDIKDWFGDKIDAGVDGVKGAAQDVVDKVKGAKDKFTETVDAGKEKIENAGRDVASWIGKGKDWFTGILDSKQVDVETAGSAIITTIKGLPALVQSGIDQASDPISLGKSIFNSLVISPINKILEAIGKIEIGWKFGKISLPDLPKIPLLETGTGYFRGGLALLGERGPELAFLPQGTMVWPAPRTELALSAVTARNLVQERQARDITINVTINGAGADANELVDRIKSEVVEAIIDALDDTT